MKKGKDRPPTLKDVARLANVSIATASRALNDPEEVTRETREKVLVSIAKLRYCPNANAVELARRRESVPKTPRSSRSGLHGIDAGVAPYLDLPARNDSQTMVRLQLLEDENARLKQLVVHLSADLETLKRVIG